jgi:CubicO group peptidase (beta-lactamase class C family)
VYWYTPTDGGWDQTSGDSSAVFAQKLQAYMAQQMRPDLVSPGPGGYQAVWRDTRISNWQVATELTVTQYESQLSSQKNAGRLPIRVQAYGVGSGTRYAAIFAADDAVQPRPCSMTGTNNANLKAFDDYMKQWLTSHSVRAGQLAIVRYGKLVYARGFTCAEAGYPATQPTSLFRIASTSKSITGIAVHQLIDAGVLHYTDKVQSILHVTQPSGAAPADPAWSTITVDQLLTHQSGLPQSPGDLAIVKASNASLPANERQWASWAATRQLAFAPGAKHEYNNLNFSLLGQIVAKLRGTSYAAAVTDRIYKPLGLSRPQIGGSLLSQRASGEVQYHQKLVPTVSNAPPVPMVARSVMSSDQPYVPNQYGGRNVAMLGGSGAWMMAAPDYAKILAGFDAAKNPFFAKNPVGTTKAMWTSPDGTATCRGWFATSYPNASGQSVATVWHNGQIEGTGAVVVRRRDGLSFVFFIDANVWVFGNSGVGPYLNKLANDVTSWPTTDLCPTVGNPPKACPATADTVLPAP